MIEHVVMLALEDRHGGAELAAVMAGLAGLVGRLDGFTGFRHGPNRDFEGKSGAYPYGFACTFRDAAALQAYAGDAGHMALGARLVALCKGGGEGIMVIDLDLSGA